MSDPLDFHVETTPLSVETPSQSAPRSVEAALPLSLADWQGLGSSVPVPNPSIEATVPSPCPWATATQQRLTDLTAATGNSVLANPSYPLKLEIGPWRGVPFLAKDLFDVAGLPTTCSSRLPPVQNCAAASDAALVLAFRSLGASLVGRTQMNEFAYGLSGENPHFGDCPHPSLPERLSGGSSSGSAYAVAAGTVPIALGTDTGGSIRVPAAWCGLYAVRLIPGLLTEGVFPLAASFDTVGWFTRSAHDLATSLDALQPFWQTDSQPSTPTGGNLPASAHARSTERPETGRWRIASLSLAEFCQPRTVRAVEAAFHLAKFTDLPANLASRLKALLEPTRKAFNVLQSREAYQLHADWLARYGEQYDPAVRQRLLRGADWTAAEIADATATRERLLAWFQELFSRFDALALPSVPGPAVAAAETTPALREQLLTLTAPASLAGLPTLAVPLTLTDRLSPVPRERSQPHPAISPQNAAPVDGETMGLQLIASAQRLDLLPALAEHLTHLPLSAPLEQSEVSHRRSPRFPA